jgi:glycosyltransferase involved in cell wall biosynthesis
MASKTVLHREYSMDTAKISGCIITYNEEKNIERCILSLQPVCDEIVVIDSYSTDQTTNICKKLGVYVFQNSFDGHIEQKNFALTKCLYDWVLSLDADEELSSDLQQSILRVKDNLSEGSQAFEVSRLTNFCDQWIKHSGWYPDRKIRLFNKKNAKWGGRNPHDRIVLKTNTKTTVLKGDLLHYSFRDIAAHVEQINKFSSIGAQSAFERKKKPNLLVQVILDPIYTFVKKYFLQLGFLDGYYGLVIAINTAHSKFLKYVKLRDLNKRKSNS